MKKFVLTGYCKIIAWLLGIAGLTHSCDIIEPRVEYGTPSADFKAKGTVTDAKSNKPIAGIRIVGQAWDEYKNDTVFTNEEGAYQLNLEEIIGFPVKIYAEDIDGEENGSFEADSLEVEKTDTKQVRKGKGWFDGVFEKTDADFKLKNT